ncbi:MAG: hypothetical protein KBD76_07620 [Bacteriovorax sp.]|nr:hypothetical protein [Bacteriovorax sp.]
MMKHLKLLTATTVIALTSTSAISYDVVDRYKLIDDKIKTEQMLRPIGHDFFLDIGATINKNITSVIKDISDASKTGTSTDKLTAAQNLLAKYDKTEQTIKLNVALGFPVFSFTAFNVKVRPNVRVFVDGGANLGIRSDALVLQDIYNLFPVAVPEDLKTFIASETAGSDIIADCIASASLAATTKALCATQKTGTYIMPNLTASVPNIQLFAKLDGKAGLFNEYSYGEHFFGDFNLYALSRTDIYQRVTKDMIAAGAKIELPKKKNTEMSAQLDYRLGYKNDNYSAAVSLEEIKVAKMKEREAESKEHSYGYSPLLRLHADALYRFSMLSLKPFVGLHKRSGYGFGDGIYLGADAGAHVWGDRLGLQLRGMVDKQYFTISPRMKLWLMQLEYSIKAPMKSMDGDVKLSALQSVDLRFFF